MLITKKELAYKTQLSVSTIDRLMKVGLPFFKTKRAVRFDLEAVLAWLGEGHSNASKR